MVPPPMRHLAALLALGTLVGAHDEWDMLQGLIMPKSHGNEIPSGKCGINGVYDPKTEKYKEPPDMSVMQCGKRMTTNCSLTYQGLECPASCPFLVPNTAFSCLLECVPEEECSAQNPNRAFANPDTKICERCPIQGCKICESRKKCKECHPGFTLEEGDAECGFDLDRAAHWPIVLLVLVIIVAILVLLGLIWFCVKGPHPNWESNMVAIMRARRHRRLSKVYSWDLVAYKGLRSRYGLAENMHKKNVLGVGVALFYNNILFMLFLSAVFLITTKLLFINSDISLVLGKFEDKTTSLMETRITPTEYQPLIIMSPLAICKNSSGSKVQEQIQGFAKNNCFVCLALYVFTFVSSVCFGFLQRRAAVIFDQQNATMSDYALRLTGLPENMTDEPALRNWLETEFRRVCPGKADRPPRVVRNLPPKKDDRFPREPSELEVFGVSVCYKYMDKWAEVDDIMWKEMEQMEVDMHNSAHYDKWELNEYNTNCGDKQTLESVQQKNREVVATWFEEGSNDKIKGSGEAFIVFSYLNDRERVLKYSEDNPGWLVHKDAPDSKMEISAVFSEPNCIAWQFVGITTGQLAKSSLRNVAWILLCIFLVQVLIVLPYAHFVLLPYATTGTAAGGLKTTIAGIVLGNVNGILFITNFMTATRVGYPRKDRMDAFVLFTNTILVLINTFFNIGITVVMVMSQGGLTFDLFHDVLDGRTLKAVGTENAIARNLFQMLMPGSFFIGLVMAMIMAGWVPFIWVSFLMKMIYIWRCFPDCILKIFKVFLPWAPESMDYYPFRSAEKAFEPWEVPICGNYADQIVTPLICFCFLFFVSPYTPKVFMGMLMWSAFEYFYFRYMHLRYHKSCFYTTNRLDSFNNFMWGLPLSVPATAAVHWGFRSELLGADHSDFFKFAIMCLTFWTGVLIWVVCYRFLVNPFKMIDVDDEKQEKTVQELSTETVYTWFNCNTPFVLKCKYYWRNKNGEDIPARRQDEGGTNHPIACGADAEEVRFFEVGKQGLFALPTQQKLVYRLENDWLEFETWFEKGLEIMDFFARTGRCGTDRRSRAFSSTATGRGTEVNAEAEMSLLANANKA